MAQSTTSSLPAWKKDLISTTLTSNILSFGEFKLKSNRISPYFFNCGRFSRGRLIRAISGAYARALDSYAEANPDWNFDILFGPAYKGIPLCATTAADLAGLNEERWGQIEYSFNRKEVKDHGEKSLIVGGDLKGKKVVIIDDVMTAGTAIREAVDLIKSQGGQLVGIIIAIDRQEKTPSQAEKEGKGDDGSPRPSTIDEVKKETGVPVLAMLTLTDIIAAMKEMGRSEEVEKMQEYYAKYKPAES